MIGEEDALGKEDSQYKPLYSTTVTCTSQDAILYYVLREEFLKLANQTNFWNILQ